MVAVIQLAIMGDAEVGGLLYDLCGYQVDFSFSAIILMLAAVVAVVCYSDNAQSEHNFKRTLISIECRDRHNFV